MRATAASAALALALTCAVAAAQPKPVASGDPARVDRIRAAKMPPVTKPISFDTPEADEILARSDIFVIPDILCNAGGVTVSYFEWVQDLQQFMWGEEQVNAQLRKLMHQAFHRVRTEAKQKKLTNRTAALSLGVQKVATEKAKRGLFP